MTSGVSVVGQILLIFERMGTGQVRNFAVGHAEQDFITQYRDANCLEVLQFVAGVSGTAPGI